MIVKGGPISGKTHDLAHFYNYIILRMISEWRGTNMVEIFIVVSFELCLFLAQRSVQGIFTFLDKGLKFDQKFAIKSVSV